MSKKLLLLSLVFGIFTAAYTKAQSLEETLSKLSSTAGAAYVKPVVTGFGSNLNSGWVSQFPEASIFKLHVDVKIIAMGSLYTDDAKTFSTTGQFYLTTTQIDAILQGSGFQKGTSAYNNMVTVMQSRAFDVNFSGPTVIGSKSDYLKINFPGQTIAYSGGSFTVQSATLNVQEVKGFLDGISALPTAAVQVTVGTFFGTNVAIRYFPDTDFKDMGKFSFWGAGLIHNIGIWFPNPLPLDVSVGYFIQKMKVGSIFESTASELGIYASKTFGSVISFTPYVGATTETSKTTVTYSYQTNQTINNVQVPAAQISMDLEGENTAGLLAGFNIHLAAVNINADIKLAKTKTASAGISFGF
jgi:hypothetical protein